MMNLYLIKMEIKTKDLKKGDIILTAINSHLQLIELLETPRLSKTARNWSTNLPEYISVKCKTNVESITYQRHYNNNTQVYNYTTLKYNLNGEFTGEKKVNLNREPLWLVERTNKQ
jgi:hypothetical protein